MAELKETDEVVEKAGKGLIRGGSARTARQFERKGAALFRRNDFKSWKRGGRYEAAALRLAGRVRKSADPLAELETAIEKARGLLPGGSRGAFNRIGRSGLKALKRGDVRRFARSSAAQSYLRTRKPNAKRSGENWRTSLPKLRGGKYKPVRKRAETRVHFTIDRTKVEKNDITGRYAAGFASVIEKDGKRVTDTQDDVIFWADLQETAHDFIKNERVAKVMHAGEMVGEVVESVLIDDDFAKALGLSDPRRGWFIKMDIADEATRKLNREGKFGGFSIGGSGQRVDLTE
ncbi:MAG: hypothetical protein KJZ75_11230 [Hyphomonadaceae bacterium]|nr:hypothetical protein [Hyphomonadaceae bacterium]